MPRRGPSEADLYLLYGFASALVFLMGIIIVMRSRGRRMYDVEARGVALDWDGLKHLYRTGTYDVREREAWDSPAARATLTGIPPLKRASKQKRERQERKERRRRRREARDTPRDDLEAGVDVAAAGGSWVEVERARRGAASPWDSPRATASAPDQNGWGPDQIADEIRAHIGRLDAGAQATFRRRLGADSVSIDFASGSRRWRQAPRHRCRVSHRRCSGRYRRARGPQRGRPGGGGRLRAGVGRAVWM